MSTMNIRKGGHYQKEFKDEVVSFATKKSITKAVQKFNVHHSTVSIWINEKRYLELRSSEKDGDRYLNIGKLCESSFIDWLSKNLSTVTYESIKEQVNLLKLIYQNIPTWLCNYSERLEDPNYKSSSCHTLYPPGFKALVVSFLDMSKLSQAKVSKIFRVSRKQLSEWHKKYQIKGNLIKTLRTSKNLLTDSEVDESILKWYQSQTVPPSANSVKSKALSLYHNSGYTNMKCSYGWYYKWCARYKIPYKEKNQNMENQLVLWMLEQLDQNVVPSHENIKLKATELSPDPNFKASTGWVIRFCRRNSLLFGTHTIHEDLLPDFLKEKFQKFKLNLDQMVSEKDLSPNTIGIVDEIALNFKNSSSLIPQSSLENSLASCIIACDMAGTVLPILLILKHTSNQIQIISERLIVYQYAEANPFENCFRYWLENIWFHHTNTPSLLLADSYSIHEKPWVSTMFESKNSSLKIVPCSWIYLASNLSELSSNFSLSVNNFCKFTTDQCSIEIDYTSVIEWVSKAYDLINHNR